jgi:hypothetical protein
MKTTSGVRTGMDVSNNTGDDARVKVGSSGPQG